MKQVLISNGQPVVVDVPTPLPGPDDLLIEVHWSCLSPGTELAALTPAVAPAPDASPASRIGLQAARVVRLGLKAVTNPARALAIGRNLLVNGRTGEALSRHLDTGTALSELGATPADPRGAPGISVGYSCAGVVRAIGSRVLGFALGDRVACAGAGRANHAELVSVQAGLVVPVPACLDLRWAATATLGAIALQGVRRADLRLGECAVVIGLGLVGQLTLSLLRAAGVRCFACDLDQRRVAQVQGLAEAVADPADLARRVREATAGAGADAVLVTAHSSSDAPLRQAIDLARRRGRVVVVGDIPMHVDRAPFYAKELDLLISCSYGPGRHDPEYEDGVRDYPLAQVRWTARRNLTCFLDLVAGKHLPLGDLGLIEHALVDAPAAYAVLADPQRRPLGVLLRCPVMDGHPPAASTALPDAADAAGLPRGLALVGAGAFACGMLIPQLRKHDRLVRWRAVVSARGVEARNLAISQGIPGCHTDLAEALADNTIHAVVIATRHQHHASQVRASLAAGRAVFCEKPLCLSWGELDELERVAEAAGGQPRLLVGFNRRFAPAAMALRQGLADRKGPLLIHYTMNAGHLPPSHWLHQRDSGGRNLGEACHAYDLIGHLVGAPPVQITAQAITPRAGHARADENFTASLRFADGSVTTLLYTSLGDPAAGKERIEVHADGCTWILDDWRSLTCWAQGQARTIWRQADDDPVDKGHTQELEQAAAFLAGQSAPSITWSELRQTSAIALWVQDCLEGHINAVLGSDLSSGAAPCAASSAS